MSNKTYISYVPHGIDHKAFFPIRKGHDKYQELQDFKKTLFNQKDYSFVLLFNSRNIRRKSIPDTLLGFKLFLDRLPQEQAKKCCIVLHTQPVDDNGTDLIAVRDMLFGESGEHHVIFSQNIKDGNYMNLLYNSVDGIILLSSNEGWGLSVTEAIMCGKCVVANVTGGIQDQARFQWGDGKWIDFDDKFMSNNIGKFRECGSWFFPVFPSNTSIQGSPMTPYIVDDRVQPADVAVSIGVLYCYPANKRDEFGLEGREWLLSEEASMSAESMCENITKSIDHVFDNWDGVDRYEVHKIDKPRKKKFIQYPISQ